MEHKFEMVSTGDICVAFGYFEGMHKGHRAVVKELVRQGKKLNMKSVLVSIVDKTQETTLTTETEKKYHLRHLDLDEFITYECEGEPDWETFVNEEIFNSLGANVIVAGKDDNIDFIKKLAKAADKDVITCDLIEENGIVITTYDIKQAFHVCNFEKITQLCGAPYIMMGRVEHGKALGRTVGMPTANIGVEKHKMFPPSGAYATVFHVEGEQYKALTNIGKRPSVDDDNRITIEAFILDFSKNIYEKTVILEVQLFVRGVVKFNSLEEVQQQVAKDVNKVDRYLDVTLGK